MVVDVADVFHHEDVDDLAVLEEAGQAVDVDVAHLTVFDQGNEKPEGHYFVGVEQKGTYDKVHTLNIV